MVLVDYSHRYNYRVPDNDPSPILLVQLRNPANLELAIEQDAVLDSGASRSVFRGEIPEMLGLNLLDGQPWIFETNTGEDIQARIHTVGILLAGTDDQPAPPPLTLELAFALSDIQRNLLGRDFFNLVQIGFRERQLQFLLLPTP